MAQTERRIRNKIRTLEDKINTKEKEIESLKKQIKDEQALLAELIEYEKLPLETRTLTRYIDYDTRTVELMDEFESETEKGFRKYQRLIIVNYFFSSVGHYQFIVERLESKNTVGNITMTEFKQKEWNGLIDYANKEITKKSKISELKENEEVIFEVPFLLRAQNSSNRTGYGNEYCGEELIYEGTLYGETTSYVFVGVKLR